MTDDPTTDDGDRHAGPAADSPGDTRDGGAGGDGAADGGAAAGTGAADEEGTTRRGWILRLLVGLGIGLPIIIETRTFIGLIRVHLLGQDRDDGGTTGTPTPTAEPSVGVGDELLDGTEPTETVREARIRVSESGWRFELSVAVENTTDVPYELRLGDVRTTAGEVVDGGASTGQIPPGESAVVEETWPLPAESRPETLQVTALSYADDGVDLTDETVTIGRVPLEG